MKPPPAPMMVPYKPISSPAGTSQSHSSTSRTILPRDSATNRGGPGDLLGLAET